MVVDPTRFSFDVLEISDLRHQLQTAQNRVDKALVVLEAETPLNEAALRPLREAVAPLCLAIAIVSAKAP